MRVLSTLVSFTAVFLIGSPALAAGSTPPPTRFSIHVKHGGWGTARVQDIEAALTSVAEVLLPHFPQHASVRVLVASSTQGPRILLEKSPDGAYPVFLNVQDTRWDQYAYQFSHELCHIFTNYKHREISRNELSRDHQWFEETLCEAVSIFALNRVASSWERSPPYPHWREYAPAFREYAERLLSEKHRNLPPDKSIAEWYRENQEALKNNPYLREKNELLATWLLPSLENTPGSLEAIGYLNLEKSSFHKSFEAYLESWYSRCPEENRNFVTRVISFFEGRGRNGRVVAALTATDEPLY